MQGDGSTVVGPYSLLFILRRDAHLIYLGMAIRLAFDLALHIDMSTHISKGIISAADASLRRQVFWASYINDQSVQSHKS
jgi:hypothetical protein